MSFGFGVGDFLTVGQLCWTVYKKCKDSPGNYTQLTNEVGALHNVIKETEELLSRQELDSQQERKLELSKSGCHSVLQDLDNLLARYDSLGTKSQRTFDRMGFGMEDMNSIRTRLISNVTLLDAFNNLSSHARLENKLNLLITEVRAGKREGSTLSIGSIDSIARNDNATWKELRRELEDVGISPLVLTEKRQFIITWFQEAVAAGKLEEEPLEDDTISDQDSSDDESDDSWRTFQYDHGEHTSQIDTNDHFQSQSSLVLVAPRVSNESTHRILPHSGAFPKLSEIRSSSQPRHKKERPRSRIAHPLLELASRIITYPLLAKLGWKDYPFFKAAEMGDTEALKILLQKGANVEARTSIYNETALHLAADGGHQAAIQFLLEKGANIEAKMGKGDWTALRLAVSQGHQAVIRVLLERGAKITTGVLALAAWKGREAVMRLLLDRGADCHARVGENFTLLHLAVTRSHKALTRLLLDRGADYNASTDAGFTALHSAARMGHPAITELLLLKGADVGARTTEHRQMPLHLAFISRKRTSLRNWEKVVRLLIQYGADTSAKDKSGQTPLSIARTRRDSSLIEILSAADSARKRSSDRHQSRRSRDQEL